MKNIFSPLMPLCLRVAMPVLLLLFYGNLTTAQSKTYASSQFSEQTIGCGGCKLLNPEGSVGSNESDHSTLVIVTSALGGSISQTLVFPRQQTAPLSKIVIGLGRGRGLSLKILGSIRVRTYLGTVFNGDGHTIDSNGLNYEPDSVQATYTFLTTRKYDRVEVELNGGLLSLGDSVKIYYAYNDTLATGNCVSPPPNPLAYYSFDVNLNDASSHQYHATSNKIKYTAIAVCKAAVIDSSYSGTIFSIPRLREPAREFTIAFWTKKITGKSEAIMSFYFGRWKFDLKYHEPYGTVRVYLGGSEKIRNHTKYEDKYHQLVFSFKNDTVAYFLDGDFKAFATGVGGSSLTPDPTIRIENLSLDDLVFYDRALSPDEIEEYLNSYDIPESAAPKVFQMLPEKPVTSLQRAHPLEFYPNPTTGTIKIKTKLDPDGSIITLTDLSGKEIYRVRLANQVLNLPSSIPAGNYLLSIFTRDRKIYRSRVVLYRD